MAFRRTQPLRAPAAWLIALCLLSTLLLGCTPKRVFTQPEAIDARADQTANENA